MSKRNPRYTVYPASYQMSMAIDTPSNLAKFLQAGFCSTVWWVVVRMNRDLAMEIIHPGGKLRMTSTGVSLLRPVRGGKVGKFPLVMDRVVPGKVEALIIPMKIGYYVQDHVELFPGNPCHYRVGIQNCLGTSTSVIEGLIDKIDELVMEAVFNRLKSPVSA